MADFLIDSLEKIGYNATDYSVSSLTASISFCVSGMNL